MRSLLVIALCLTGCSTSRPALPEQPNAPTDTAIVQAVGKDWDKIDQKVAASVAIARENKDKPAVVEAETTVALSYLPSPSPEELALARQRAARSDQKDYADAVAYGKKLLAKIDADWAKVAVGLRGGEGDGDGTRVGFHVFSVHLREDGLGEFSAVGDVSPNHRDAVSCAHNYSV